MVPFVYCLGGLTFLPLVIIAILLHAYFTFPVHDDTHSRGANESILRPGDDVDAIKSAQKSLGEKFQLHNNHEADVAAGYFAISREYSPGGVNGKPPERTTPVGSATVSAPSPSVYQSMYRSLFERKTNNGPLDNKAAGKPQKKGGNVFYVVLRHGHLMLFDNEDQLEVRYVVSLAHHDVSIYSGPNDITPEGELFIKRNAICLSRKQGVGEITADGKPSQPFYLFSENCSDKEDFYFALLRNQDSDSTPKPPVPLQYDVKDIITLVQRLHSSEEHLQTRWINALVGRVFLALYKTPDIEDLIRTKITKKISRVKTPNFLRQITLRNVNMGEAAPVITNPRLKDLTVDGELVVEADFRYTGNFRLEVAAIARLELGARFKAREVDLLLAAVLRKIEGHMLLRIKPPPSNRLWVTFETMPKIDMTIEPIVSSRQITYTLILRQIENRIKEVVAESLVYPNWDDSPFASTVGKLWRGGIWADDRRAEHSQEAEAVSAEHGDVDEVEISEAEHDESTTSTPQIEKSYSAPVLDTNLSNTMHSRKGTKSTSNLTNPFPSSSSTGVDARPLTGDKPRVLRSGSFANASSPVVTTDITNADAFKPSSPPNGDHAATAMAKLSAKTELPVQSPTGSPNRPTNFKPSSSQSSSSSRGSSHSEKADMSNSIPQVSLEPPSLTDKSSINSYPTSPASLSTTSIRSELSASKSFGTPKRENTTSSTKSSASENRRLSLAAVTNAAATAKTWGWNAIQRRSEQRGSSSSGSTETAQPRVMGRGQPLPPPGVPLPLPDKKTKTAPIPVPKRKPMPPPVLPQRHEREPPTGRQHHTAPAPPLPRRNSRKDTDTADDGLLIVSAPSEPTTPVTEDSPQYMQPWVDDVDEMDENQQAQADAPSPAASVAREPPQLPKRRHPRRVVSSSPEEYGHKLPSWMAAQEQEARAKSTFVDEDAGL